MDENKKITEVRIVLTAGGFITFWLGVVLAFAIGFSLGSVIQTIQHLFLHPVC